jgi:hypothetical protein
MISSSFSRTFVTLGKVVLATSFACALLAPMTEVAQKPYRVQTKWTIGR